MKKLLALLLTLCLCVIPLCVSAETEEVPEEETAVETEIVEVSEEELNAMMKQMLDEQLAANQELIDAKKDIPLPDGLVYQSCISRVATPIGLITLDDIGAFREDEPSVLYISVREYYSALSQSGYITAPLITAEDGNLIISRDNGSTVEFMREGNQILFNDLDLFNASQSAVNGGDPLALPEYQTDELSQPVLDEDGNQLINLNTRADHDTSYARAGSGVIGSFDEYHIDVYWTDDDLYVPLAVMNNIFNCGCAMNIVYLDGCAYTMIGYQVDSTAVDEDGKTMADYYYSVQQGDRPEALAELTYNLLCMELDLKYGLKSEHGIGDSFEEFFETVGLDKKLKAADGQTFYNGLYELTRAYFCDFHSTVNAPGPYAGLDYSYELKSYPSAMTNAINNMVTFGQARVDADLADVRDEVYCGQSYEVFEPYMEVGDTAYITFDSFYCDGTVNYYSEDVKENLQDYIGYDTFALISYANSQITREDSPIRKVVLDLSNNGGGVFDTAVFVASWMMGDCKFSTTNPITSADYTVVYKSDVNLDGKITEDDTLDGKGLELYCLTSGCSFSCGNLVPAMFKESGKVILLGQTTGGGACVVQSSIAADGTIFCYSSNKHICTVKNGSYYSVDQGVAPDFTISKPAHFYDREWLTEFIANLA